MDSYSESTKGQQKTRGEKNQKGSKKSYRSHYFQRTTKKNIAYTLSGIWLNLLCIEIYKRILKKGIAHKQAIPSKE